jgi:hypothetical protein
MDVAGILTALILSEENSKTLEVKTVSYPNKRGRSLASSPNSL